MIEGLTPAEIAKAKRALKRLDDLEPVMQRCERCQIPMHEPRQLIDEQRQTLRAILAEFGPQSPLTANIEAREKGS